MDFRLICIQTSLNIQRKKVNIITGQGGGGHYATYHAIRAIAEERQLPWEFQITDMDDIITDLTQQNQIQNAYEMFGFSGHDLYNLMLKSGWTWLWPLKMRLNKFLVKLNYEFGLQFFESHWRKQQPDIVVSLMPLYNKGLYEALQRAKSDTPYISAMVDFADYPPAFWIEPDTDIYTICGTQKAVEQARTLGVKEDLIVQSSGMIIHPRFYQQQDENRSIHRERLGLDPDCLTGIVMFGGNGSKNMLEIAQRLECFGEKLQLIFLCGRNQELASKLKNNQSAQKRYITTFTTDVPYFMHLADFFIGKPGPGSLSEALVMNLPVITECNNSTLIHERYNAKWIEEKQVGLVLRNFSQIKNAVKEFLQAETFARYRQNVAFLDNRAVFEVCDIIQQTLANQTLIKNSQFIKPISFK